MKLLDAPAQRVAAHDLEDFGPGSDRMRREQHPFEGAFSGSADLLDKDGVELRGERGTRGRLDEERYGGGADLDLRDPCLVSRDQNIDATPLSDAPFLYEWRPCGDFDASFGAHARLRDRSPQVLVSALDASVVGRKNSEERVVEPARQREHLPAITAAIELEPRPTQRRMFGQARPS